MKTSYLALLALGAVTVAQPASAAFIDVRTFWSERIGVGYGPDFAPLPSTLSATCFGAADRGSSASSCLGGLHVYEDLNAKVHAGGVGTEATGGHETATGGITLTNLGTDSYFGMVTVLSGFSAFNPGGPSIGLTLDNLYQWGSFVSTVRSAGPGRGFGGDTQGCFAPGTPGSHSNGTYNWTNFSALTCGESGPDSSSQWTFFGFASTPIAPGESVTFAFTSTIDYSFGYVPEPATLGIFSLGLAGLTAMRRRRSPLTA